MTNVMFWSLVPAAIGVFLLIAWLTDRVLCAIERVYRRWACRREMARMRKEIKSALIYRVTIPEGKTVSLNYDSRRLELDALATAQDKQTRRIVH